MARKGETRMTEHWRMIRIPDGMTVDGAVVELTEEPDGILTAIPRIPAPTTSGGETGSVTNGGETGSTTSGLLPS